MNRPGPPSARPEPGPGLALALGGGGARGIAHIVLLEVLDEMGLRPGVIAGTSMGAVVGAAYAAGMPARDIRAHAVRVLRNRRLVMGRMLEARVGRFTDLLTRGLVNPVLLDAERVLPLFWPEHVPATFEELRIPLLVSATDFHARTGVILDSGDLRGAVSASMAVPGLIRPVRREGRILIDGGVVDPLPYECLLGRAAPVVACDVSPGRVDEPAREPRPLEVMLGAAQIMQAALSRRMLEERPPNLVVRPAVDSFRLLEFFHAARILEAADAGRDAIKRSLDALLGAGAEATP